MILVASKLPTTQVDQAQRLFRSVLWSARIRALEPQRCSDHTGGNCLLGSGCDKSGMHSRIYDKYHRFLTMRSSMDTSLKGFFLACNLF